AALATLDVLVEERLPARAEPLGAQFLGRLNEIRVQHPGVVSAVRGRGLMLGVEFAHRDYALMTSAEAGRRGVITFYTLNNPSVIRIEPPLVITPELVDRACEGIAGAVAGAARLLAGVREASAGS
ncbi:MAG TPA: aminotransferase class III-fold pyridoxal phosphate-dependent enzyme, partial [bacterium]|nr:aminotransferase class III-fold pyridoxal phosphate-dependent enzyme [bacterium]